MKKIFQPRLFQLLALMLISLFVLSKAQKAFAEDAPGLAVFKKYKCNQCHAISTLNVKVEESKGGGGRRG